MKEATHHIHLPPDQHSLTTAGLQIRPDTTEIERPGWSHMGDIVGARGKNTCRRWFMSYIADYSWTVVSTLK